MMITFRSAWMPVWVAMAVTSGSAMAQSFDDTSLMLAATGVGAASTGGTMTNTPATPGGTGLSGPGGGGVNNSNVRTTNPALRQGGGNDASSAPPANETGDSLQQQRQQSGERMVKERKGQVQDAN